jgi:glucosaminylphosphatidylinositol acyltransferase
MKEHVSEYGVHWNFFMTLGLLPPFVTLFRLISRNRIPLSVFAAVIVATYEWALKNMSMQGYPHLTAYIVSSPRDTYFNQNREGIFSFLGIFREMSLTKATYRYF